MQGLSQDWELFQLTSFHFVPHSYFLEYPIEVVIENVKIVLSLSKTALHRDDWRLSLWFCACQVHGVLHGRGGRRRWPEGDCHVVPEGTVPVLGPGRRHRPLLPAGEEGGSVGADRRHRASALLQVGRQSGHMGEGGVLLQVGSQSRHSGAGRGGTSLRVGNDELRGSDGATGGHWPITELRPFCGWVASLVVGSQSYVTKLRQNVPENVKIAFPKKHRNVIAAASG